MPASRVPWRALASAALAATVPALADTNGYVSIKVQAADAAGNDVAQTILNGYSLTADGAT